MPDVIDNVKVGERIKGLLKSHNMTQDELAEKLFISKSAVSQNLRGKSTFDIQNLIQIAKLFEISLDELLNLKEDQKEETISEYRKVVNRGLSAINLVSPMDLRIYEPDMYGKVLVDYIIEQKKIDMFDYLHNVRVDFVKDYYHRAKEIYVKIIKFMLEEGRKDIFDYVLKHTELNGNFIISDKIMEYVIWGLLDSNENQDLVKSIIEYKLQPKGKIFSSVKDKYPLTKTDYIQLIAQYKLKNVFNTFMRLQLREDDLLYIVNKFIEEKFIEGIYIFIDYFYYAPVSWIRKATSDAQKAILAILEVDDFDLLIQFAQKGIFTDITPVIKKSIENHQDRISSHLIAKYANQANFKKIGEVCMTTSNINMFDSIKRYFTQDDLNYLLGWVKSDDMNMLLFLLKQGAKVDEKYYNLETFKKINNFIDFFLEKEKKNG